MSEVTAMADDKLPMYQTLRRNACSYPTKLVRMLDVMGVVVDEPATLSDLRAVLEALPADERRNMGIVVLPKLPPDYNGEAPFHTLASALGLAEERATAAEARAEQAEDAVAQAWSALTGWAAVRLRNGSHDASKDPNGALVFAAKQMDGMLSDFRRRAEQAEADLAAARERGWQAELFADAREKMIEQLAGEKTQAEWERDELREKLAKHSEMFQATRRALDASAPQPEKPPEPAGKGAEMTRDEELAELARSTPEKLYWEQRGPYGGTITLFAPNVVAGCEVHPWNLLNTDADEWDMQGENIRDLLAAAPDLLRELIEARRLLREASERLPYVGNELDIEWRIRAFLDGETKP